MVKFFGIRNAARMGILLLMLGLAPLPIGCRREAAPPESAQEDTGPRVEIPVDDPDKETTAETATADDSSNENSSLELNRPDGS